MAAPALALLLRGAAQGAAEGQGRGYCCFHRGGGNTRSVRCLLYRLARPSSPASTAPAGTNWVRNVLTTTLLFCGPLLAMFSYLNTVAWAYGTTAALPFGTIVIIIVIWALVTFPLTVVGGIMGKNTKVGGGGAEGFGQRAGCRGGE